MQNYVEFNTAQKLNTYAEEVKKNNLSIIGTSSESPLEVGEYEGTITGNMSRIVGKTNSNDWCIFLTEVSVSKGKYNGTTDRIPFNPATMLKKNTLVSFEIYLDKKGLKRGKLVN
jgi:hypothetical protein|tara:strand:- start:227 stop:571 length:345 start_codon:yes stop_codon:yes gene_type:complete